VRNNLKYRGVDDVASAKGEPENVIEIIPIPIILDTKNRVEQIKRKQGLQLPEVIRIKYKVHCASRPLPRKEKASGNAAEIPSGPSSRDALHHPLQSTEFDDMMSRYANVREFTKVTNRGLESVSMA